MAAEHLKRVASAPITRASLDAEAKRTARRYNAALAYARAAAAVDGNGKFTTCPVCGWPDDHRAYVEFRAQQGC